MAYDERLASRIRRALGDRQEFTERKMFGGLAFLCAGRMCCGIVGNELMVRVRMDEFDAALRKRHVRPMDFTGKPLRGFVYVSAQAFRTATALRRWLSYGERAVKEKFAQPQKSGSRGRLVSRRRSG